MDNTRTLRDSDVPTAAIESVERMTSELVDSLIADFISGLVKKGGTIDQPGIDMLKGVVTNRATVTMKIGIKVDTGLVSDLQIPIIPLNQASIQSFGVE